MTNSWMNEDGEPIMSGEAWRFEQQLDAEYQPDEDDYYRRFPEPEWFDCRVCGEPDSVDPEDGVCGDCGSGPDDEPSLVPEMEDQWLDGSYEE